MQRDWVPRRPAQVVTRLDEHAQPAQYSPVRGAEGVTLTLYLPLIRVGTTGPTIRRARSGAIACVASSREEIELMAHDLLTSDLRPTASSIPRTFPHISTRSVHRTPASATHADTPHSWVV